MDKRSNIRTLALVGEWHQGKTSLAETLVAAYKASKTRGEEQEQERCSTKST
jgi:translation elongation factor EF-G